MLVKEEVWEVGEGKSSRRSHRAGGFVFINNSMALSSSGSTSTSVSQSAASAVPAAPSAGQSSSESASSPPGPAIHEKMRPPYFYTVEPVFASTFAPKKY